MGTLRLGGNIDHVATLRQARYGKMPESKTAEPDPIVAAAICERCGAHGIVAHLRADRRHIIDRDIERLRENIMTKLNLEMGNTPEIVDVALRIVPDEVCLVPEKREEVTTEGGLDVVSQRKELEPTITRLHSAAFVSACLSIQLWNKSMPRPNWAPIWSSCIPGNCRTRSPRRSRNRNCTIYSRPPKPPRS